MIIHFKKETPNISALQDAYKAILLNTPERFIFVTPSNLKTVSEADQQWVEASFPMNSDIQLASRDYLPQVRSIQIAENIVIGGDQTNTLMITGPCSVESEEQIESAAQFLVKNNVKVLRAGCFKPRTSPYTFQGMGSKGLDLLVKMREKYGLKIITEVKDATHVEEVIEKADIIQIGAKAMYDHGILHACSKTQKPILLKRGFGSTLQEFVQSAEYMLSGGNPNVMLCERGIRTFESKTRFTLDLCGVAFLKEYTNLPVILDPSHAMGYRYGVPDLTRACLAMGVDGLLIETHPDPSVAMSDAAQQLNYAQFESLHADLKRIAPILGKNMI